MKYAKVITINDKVEVIVKKVIVDGQAAINFNFITELENEMVNISLESIYSLKKTRDTAFTELSTEDLISLSKNLPTFKDLV